MANLNGTPSFGTVYQLETNDPVVGGTPNAATGAGKSNIPHLQLLNMALWLKERIESAGIGTDAPLKVNLSTLLETDRFFSFSSTAAGAPDLGAAYDGIGVYFGSAGHKLQLVSCTPTQPLLFRIDEGSGWSTWVDLLTSQRGISTSGLAIGGGDLSADRTISVPGATQAQAEAGTDNSTAMTPLRVAQAIAAFLAGAEVSFAGQVTALRLRLTSTGDASLTSTTHAFQAGDTAGQNLIIDNNEIMARNNGLAGNLLINNDGGDVTIGGAASDIVIAGTMAGGVIATQAQAEAGTVNNRLMTPLRVVQAIAAAISSGIVQPAAAILSAISGLATNGMIVRTGAGSVAARTITGAGPVSVTNGNGVAGNPSIAVEIASQAEAEAGTSNDKLMTPLRVAQDIAAVLAGQVTFGAGVTAQRLRLLASSDVTLASTMHGLQIGEDAAANLIVDNNELQARNAGAAATILLNAEGGNVTLGDGQSTINMEGSVAGAVVATTAQAQAGTSNEKLMTPLRTLTAMNAYTLGRGQTWQDMTGSRTIATSYQNTTDRPIMVSIDVTGNNATGNLQVSANGSTWLTVANRDADGNAEWFSTIVPPGTFYRLTGTVTFTTWAELR